MQQTYGYKRGEVKWRKLKALSIKVEVKDVFTTACKLPYYKIQRDAFLTLQFKDKVSNKQLADELENGKINASIPKNYQKLLL